jgi:hypothetical protein
MNFWSRLRLRFRERLELLLRKCGLNDSEPT